MSFNPLHGCYFVFLDLKADSCPLIADSMGIMKFQAEPTISDLALRTRFFRI